MFRLPIYTTATRAVTASESRSGLSEKKRSSESSDFNRFAGIPNRAHRGSNTNFEHPNQYDVNINSVGGHKHLHHKRINSVIACFGRFSNRSVCAVSGVDCHD